MIPVLILLFHLATETILGRLLKQSLNSAIEKAVSEAVEKAVKKTVEEQVRNAIGRDTQYVAGNAIATIKTDEPSKGSAVIDLAEDDLTEDQSDEDDVEEESNNDVGEVIRPGHTYLIYSKLCCWRILMVDDRLNVRSTRGSAASLVDYSFISPSSLFQWKCIEEDGYFCFENEATKSFLRVKCKTGRQSFLAATRYKNDRNMFRLERGLADGTCKFYFLGRYDTCYVKVQSTTPAQCCRNRSTLVADYKSVIWRFREVPKE